MSYDLRVYASEELDREALVGLLDDCGLAVDEAQAGRDLLTVVRGVKRAYSFTSGIPDRLEPEDVPEEVTALLLEARYLYEVMIEGSSPSEVAHAVRFARKLAQASKGVVVNEQDGTIWSRGKMRVPPKVERGRIDVVEMRWWVTDHTAAVAGAAAWLEVARRHLPEALPRRWGVYEPLSEKADPDQPDDFAHYVAQADGSVYFKASAPAIEGHGAAFEYRRSLDSYSLTLHRSALDEEGWRDSAKRLFTDFADRAGAVLGTAEVIRDMDWSGRSLGYEVDTEHAPYLTTGGGWAGLPPYPVWWTWFGPDYVPLVRDHLAAEQVATSGSGLFHWRSDMPADRDQLAGRRRGAGGHGRLRKLLRKKASPEVAADWLPAELLAVQPSFDPKRESPPYLTPAQVRPSRLS